MKPYFEGWYFKHQSGGGSAAFIPGLNIDKDGTCRAFLQIITDDVSYYLNYDFYEFSYEKYKDGCPTVRLAHSYFSKNGIELDINSEEVSVKGLVTYGELCPLKYDIMGPFKLLPFLECRHGIISMGHRLYGYIKINGKVIDFNGGTGYIETDRGYSFPSGYLWTQSNFNLKNGSNSDSGPDSGRVDIFASAAAIPLFNLKFNGCICVIYFNNKEYRFATYLGCKILKYDKSNLILKQGKYRFDLHFIKGNTHILSAPDMGKMTRTIHESVSSTVQYRLYIHDELIFDIKDDRACFEFV